MRLRPIDSAAALALGKAIVAREDVWRHPPADEFARDRAQKMIALRASREGTRSHVDPEADDDFAQLLAERVARDEHDVRRGPEALISRYQDPAFSARDF